LYIHYSLINQINQTLLTQKGIVIHFLEAKSFKSQKDKSSKIIGLSKFFSSFKSISSILSTSSCAIFQFTLT
jgi:hypothetical protein